MAKTTITLPKVWDKMSAQLQKKWWAAHGKGHPFPSDAASDAGKVPVTPPKPVKPKSKSTGRPAPVRGGGAYADDDIVGAMRGGMTFGSGGLGSLYESLAKKAIAKHVENISEAKDDAREYDYEGDMAMSQLKSIITNAQRLHDMLEENTNLPEWVQSKITLAEDYVLTAANYCEGNLDEEVEQMNEEESEGYSGSSPAEIKAKYYHDIAQERRVGIHDLAHLDDRTVYDETQTNNKIKDGDVLKLSGGRVAIMNRAWPVMHTGDSEHLHQLESGHTFDSIENGKYAASNRVANRLVNKINEEDKEGRAYAIGMSTAMKKMGDKPPLRKGTITRAHEIARAILRKEN